MLHWFKRVSLLFFTIFALSAFASDPIDDVLIEIGNNAAPQYLAPMMKAFGSSMNSGWHNSSKPLSFMGLRMGISIANTSMSMAAITKSMETFNLNTTIPMSPEIFFKSVDASGPVDKSITKFLPEEVHIIEKVPTVFGSKEAPKISIRQLIANSPNVEKDSIYKYIDGNRYYTLPFRGIIPGKWLGPVPNIYFFTIGLDKIPVLNNLTGSFSYAPALEWKIDGLGDFSFDLLNYKIQHEFLSHIPSMNNQELFHLSLSYAQNWLKLGVRDADLEFKSWTTMLSSSLDFKSKFFGWGGFAGIGLESSEASFEVKQDKELELAEISANIDPMQTMRYQIGVRISFLIFDIWGEYNFGHTSTFALGTTLLGFNGL